MGPDEATSAPAMSQSSGGFLIPHTLPGFSSARPSRKNRPSVPNGKQFATRAVACRPPGNPSSNTRVPGSSARDNFTPQPCGFTTSVCDSSAKMGAGDKVASRNGTSTRIRVIRRVGSDCPLVVLMTMAQWGSTVPMPSLPNLTHSGADIRVFAVTKVTTKGANRTMVGTKSRTY